MVTHADVFANDVVGNGTIVVLIIDQGFGLVTHQHPITPCWTPGSHV